MIATIFLCLVMTIFTTWTVIETVKAFIKKELAAIKPLIALLWIHVLLGWLYLCVKIYEGAAL